MYAWIWRHLPFGIWGRMVGTLLLSAGVAALLWFVVFPWADPLLPFDDVQVEDPNGVPGGGAPPGVGPTGSPGSDVMPTDEHAIPYETGD